MESGEFSIGVLISGSGTTLRNLIERCQRGDWSVKIAVVISSNADAAGNQFALHHGLPLEIVTPKQFADVQSFSDAVFHICRQARVQLVVMGGFLRRLIIPPDFENRVINIHPALIPAFCGKGFYGRRVHQAVIQYGCKTSGCTVHFVDNQYDHGPIIAQRCVDVQVDDTPETLQQRVFRQECALYPQVIQAIADGRVKVDRRRVLIH